MSRAGGPQRAGAWRRRRLGRRGALPGAPAADAVPEGRTAWGVLRLAVRVLWLASPILVALLVLLGSAHMAPATPAQTTPTSEPAGSTTTTIPTVQPSTPAVDPLDPDDLDDAQRDADAEEELVGQGAVSNPCQPTDGSAEVTAQGTIVPDDCWGDFPSSSFDIGCDEGAWNHIGRKVYCTFTDLAYQGSRSATATALWMVEWAYAFGVYERLGGPAITIAESYESNMIGPLGLAELAWFYAIAWAGLNILRGKLTLAGGELAASVVMAALAAILLANPAGYLNGAFDTMGTVSGALLSTGTGQPPPDDALDADAVLQPLQAHLHQAFVEDPYDHLNWGGSDMPAQCRNMRDRILALGPWGNSDAPRDAMEMAGCTEQAEFNHDPSGQRLFGAVLTMTAALVMVVLIGLVSLTIVVAQIVAVVLFAVAPFAALGAILTGGARRIALGWIAAVIRVILVVIGMSFVLSLLLLTIEALLSAGAEADLIERFALVNIVVIAMFGARRRVLHTGADMANSIGSKLSPQAISNNENWLAASTVAGVSGFAIASGLNSTPSRSRAMATNAATTRVGQRKAYNSAMNNEARGLRPIARESVSYEYDPETDTVKRAAPSVSISGAQPMSRRAKAARLRLERQSVRQLRTQNPPDAPDPTVPRREDLAKRVRSRVPARGTGGQGSRRRPGGPRGGGDGGASGGGGSGGGGSGGGG